ncbi:FISUMP domain-containing protein [Fibrobacter sp. UWB5]|uniref:FISUMP domain-containing protein n=1 Tax=Fibrobacter sp. UWB5 TaxID=1964360 RepID=UPI000B52358F|nr:FISUMP domain-containing protein [Fibrobacter sp. UWB5]OWV14142.1 hypothetical protein B7989_01340 [Fibrobacter sp. UWB5]
MIIHGETSIYEAMKKIQCNGFVIPAFQRSYVWSVDQVSCLWDSILSDYPISTFLFWKIEQGQENIAKDTVFFQFIKNALFRSNKNVSEHDNDGEEIKWSENEKLDSAVLDGQQRLTSLYITLFGQVNLIKGRKTKFAGEPVDLCIQLDKGAVKEQNADDDVQTKFDIGFYEECYQSPTLFNIKRIISTKFYSQETRNDEIDKVLKSVPEASREYARKILAKLCEKIYDKKIIQYQQITGTENDALDMFVRFNNGGTKLTKSEIGEAIIGAFWKKPHESLCQVFDYKKRKGKLHQEKFKEYKDFPLDFFIRLSVILYEKDVNANIHRDLVYQMHINWEKIKSALLKTQEFVYSIRRLHIEDFRNRWNILIPIVYLVYNHILPEKNGDDFAYSSDYLLCKDAVEAYISRAILFKYYSNATTNKLAKLKNEMNKSRYNGYPRLTMQILDSNPDLRVTEEKIENILNLQKGDTVCERALQLISSERLDNEIAFNPEVTFDVDHLHARVRFSGMAPDNIHYDTWEKWKRLCNTMPNLSMLNSTENKVKSDLSLKEYVSRQGESYKIDHLIPDTDLDLTNFGEFFEKRKVILKKELEKILHKDEDNEPTTPKENTPKDDEPKIEKAEEDESPCPPALHDSRVYDAAENSSISEIESDSDPDSLERGMNEYEESRGNDDSWEEKYLSDYILCANNPIANLAVQDRNQFYNEKPKEPAYKSNLGFLVDKRDGTRYQTIKIGNQVWMAENLRFETDGAYRYRNDDPLLQTHISDKGLFYSRAALMGVAPEGWRIPHKRDFEELLAETKGNADSLKRIKEWIGGLSPYVTEEIENGFGALPEGYYDKHYQMYCGGGAFFWTLDSEKDEYDRDSYPYMHITENIAIIERRSNSERCFSVRCIKI